MAQYTKNPPLIETAVLSDPLAQFERWFADAEGAGLVEPTAMVLATVDADGQPSARVVLYKGWHQGGLCFYTNYDSRKGEALAANPRAAATFWWDRLERSVRFEGQVRKLPESLSEQYFHSRPRGSQIGAWTSRQSQVVASREQLDARLADNERRYAEGEVPLPPYWGGYALVPERVEFWQGRLNRLHDRLRYRRAGESWLLERLEP
ncbi:pyridoxamine 5'-phosphate oxidase [Stagnimonas aquatica]|uniref:Pyridoxine/pyridoxamine 5'-phosphate oxidase n=1 Tax=Stagnimonas aquatica TaxID=2689987 RepID=A0A3N0VKT2_9GAMM|nr:pyridoxamine 5'-phosphate oxidase [Stagnimonas aquatica]ROH93376.1 pyridoxamine 5'-phosphate oxidase [Stagnimonas aquatica]